MSIRDEMKAGELYLCPISWNHTLGKHTTSHLIIIKKVNPYNIVFNIKAKVLTPCTGSQLRDAPNVILSNHSVSALLHVDSIHRLILGVRHDDHS